MKMKKEKLIPDFIQCPKEANSLNCLGFTPGKLYKVIDFSKSSCVEIALVKNDFGNKIVVTLNDCSYIDKKDWLPIPKSYRYVGYVIMTLALIAIICVISFIKILSKQ